MRDGAREPRGRMADDRPIVNVVGQRVALGPLAREHLALHARWGNDPTTQRSAGDRVGPRTAEALEAWFDGRVATAGEQVWFTVYATAGWAPVGFTCLRDIDHAARSAEFGVTIAPERRDAGYGTEATLLTLDYGFTALGLHNIMLTVAEFSARGRRAYARAGFRECGRRRQVWPMGGRLWDEIFMECLSTEFESPGLGKLFAPDEPRESS